MMALKGWAKTALLLSILLSIQQPTVSMQISFWRSASQKESSRAAREWGLSPAAVRAATDLKATIKRAATVAGGTPSIMFAMADWNALVERLPTVVASLATVDPARGPGRHLIVGVQTHKEFALCQQLHSTCWLDDGSTIPFAPVPEGEETRIHSADILRLAWRKVEVARYALSLGVRIIGIDLDLIFNKDPFLLLAKESPYSELDFFVQSEVNNHTWAVEEVQVNIGFYCLSPTAPAKRLVTLWLSDLRLWDQDALRGLLQWKAVPELKWTALPTSVAFSLCHVGVGDWGLTSNFGHGNIVVSAPDYAAKFEGFLRHHGNVLRNTTVFHFPCVLSPGRKGAFVSLALSALSRPYHPPRKARPARVQPSGLRDRGAFWSSIRP